MTNAIDLGTVALPLDFVWRQSIVADYLRCPRRVYLQHVAQVPADYALDGYASIAGTAMHHGLAEIVNGLQLGDVPSRERLAEVLVEGFTEAIVEEQDRGATTDPERLQPALDKLQGEQLDLLMVLLEDPRLKAIDWRGAEEEFEFVDAHGRRFTGTVDAHGVARDYVANFATSGRGERVALQPGDMVIVDWKTGSEGPPLDFVARSLNVQLGFYRAVLAGDDGPPPRTFLGVLRDLERPKLPRDPQGNSIPKRLEEINPAYAQAVGIKLEDRRALEQCRKRPTGIPKWIERDNPAWIEATSRPKGPLFHECTIDDALVARSIADAIDGARLGLWPAAGAVNGECRSCPWRTKCTGATA